MTSESEEIKKLKAQIKWYQDKLEEHNQLYYQESKLIRIQRRLACMPTGKFSFILKKILAKLKP